MALRSRLVWTCRWLRGAFFAPPRGTADPASAKRKAAVGDWREYFTDADKHIYKEVAGKELIELGYAVDDRW